MYHCLPHTGSFFRRYRIMLMMWWLVCCFLQKMTGQHPCPNNIKQNTDKGLCDAIVNGIGISINDHTVTSYVLTGVTTGSGDGDADGQRFNAGTTTVSYVYIDAGNESSTCGFEVTVEDNEPPTLKYKPFFTLELNAMGNAILYPSDIDEGSTDNCGILSLMIKRKESLDDYATSLSFNCYDLKDVTGSDIIVLLRVDCVSGNSYECESKVTVVDKISPVAQCISQYTLSLDASGTATLNAMNIENGSSDNCGISKYLIKRKGSSDDYTPSLSFNCNDLKVLSGDITIVFRVEDASGNFDECETLVSIEDNIFPVARCKPVTLSLDANGQVTLFPENIDGGSTDNCSIASSLIQRTESPYEYSSSLIFDCNDVLTQDGIGINLKITDSSGNSNVCSTSANVLLNPSLNPMVVFREEEICNETDAELVLSHPGFSTLTRWCWETNVPAGITPAGVITDTKDGDQTVSFPFNNANNAAGKLTFTVTPTIVYSSMNQCKLNPVIRELWVNPHPQLLDIEDATICNETETPILVRTSSIVSNHAAVYYGWEVSDYSFGANDSDREYEVRRLPPLTQITQLLNNQSYTDQDVTYTLSPSLHLNGKVCPSPAGFKKEVTVTVMPTPVIQVTVSDETVCNKQLINFTVNSPNIIEKGTWKSNLNFVTETGNNVAPTPPSQLQNNATFSQTITNSTYVGRKVNYTFSPQIVIENNTCNARSSTSKTISVNPTPIITSFTPNRSDSICHNTGATIIMNSPNGQLFGTLKYMLEEVDYNPDAVQNVANPGVDEFMGKTATIQQSLLENTSNSVQTVAYHMYPFIEYGNSLHCDGNLVEKKLYLAPEVIFDVVADTVFGGNHITCYNASNGKIRLENISGGWQVKGYDYIWSENAHASNAITVISGLSAERYSITVRDKMFGCSSYKEKTLKQPEEELQMLQPVIKPQFCKYSFGYIKVNARGGTQSDVYPYNYEWIAKGIFDDYYGETDSFSNLRTGKYTITVIDVNNCKSSANYDLPYVPNNDSLIIGRWIASSYGPDQNNGYYNISCHGADNGSLNVLTNPPKSASAYTWKRDDIVFKNDSIMSDGAYFTDRNGDFGISNLPPGDYEITIIDDAGCELVSEKYKITQPPPITFKESVSSDGIQCHGDKAGSIILSDVAGAFGNTYKYQWSTSDGDANDIDLLEPSRQLRLGAGTYHLSIVSQYDCSISKTFAIVGPAELIAIETIPDFNGFQIPCFGNLTGSINLNVSGGNGGPYEFLWNTFDGSGLSPRNQNQTGLSQGAYLVDISYNKGLCITTKKYELHSPTRIKNDSIISDIMCYGNKDASIQISITGGMPSYNYQWSSNNVLFHSDAPNQSNLSPGVYQLKVTDANNCVKTETYTLTEPDPVNPNLYAENMSCYPGNDGYITAHPLGGTNFGYTYLWNNLMTVDSISGLLPGAYSVIVTDANGCTGTASADIQIPLPLKVTAEILSDYNGYHIDCYGNNTGIIDLNIQNGRSGYVYVWSSGDDTKRIDNARYGDYSVTVTDRFNCVGSASVSLTQPDRLWGQSTVTDVICPGDDSGSMLVLAGGGVTPYHYLWSNSVEDAPFAGFLKAGTYYVRISDDNDCYHDLQATITQPPEFVVEFIHAETFCPETNDGDIRAVVSGGTPPYTYLWQNISGAISPNIAELHSGIYSLEVTDAMQCKYNETTELGYTNAECLRIPNAFSPNDDGANDRWEIFVGDKNSATRYHVRDVYPEVIVEVYSGKWGMLLYRSQKGYPEPWDGKFQGKYLPMDSYVYRIILNNHTKPITGNVFITR